MDNLLDGMRCMELVSFDGEWSEHEMLEEWMLKAYEYGGRLDEDDVKMENTENKPVDAALNEDIQILSEDAKMEFEDEDDDQENGTYEAWLNNELLAMDVDGDTRELILRKTTFLNISDKAYYGGGTWFMDRWYNTPANNVGCGEFRSRRWGSSLTVCARWTVRFSPHQHERKFSGARVCRVTFKHLPQPLISHIFQFFNLFTPQYVIVRGVGGVSQYFF